MTISVRHVLALATCAVLLGGCGGSPDPTPEEAVDPTGSSSPSESGPGESGADEGGPGKGGGTGQAVADLAARLGLDAAEVEVVAVEQVTWRDGSRGCAEPGTMYTQALVEGTRIILRADGADHEYHSGGGQRPVLCEDPTE